jgi:excinuclease ABC subunit C
MQTPLKEFSKDNIKESLQVSGVYLLYNEKKQVIYIGKAKNLKNRLSSYFNPSLGSKTEKMVSEAVYFRVISVDSEVEALILEANLIKRYLPKFNFALKDDKHPLYIRIINNGVSYVATCRKKDINKNTDVYYGPFPSSQNVKSVLKLIRRVVPYPDHPPTKRVCINHQLGLCDPCPSQLSNSESLDTKMALIKTIEGNVKRVRRILEGKTKQLEQTLQRLMYKASNEENFELAKRYRDMLEKLNYITSTRVKNAWDYLENPNLLEDIRKKRIEKLKDFLSDVVSLKNLSRIECYDISHISGVATVASMVVFIDGIEEKSLYRRFRVTQERGVSDTDSLKEVAIRRKKHLDDWGIPDLIVVDGGKPQVRVFREIFEELNIPIIGLAKRNETVFWIDLSGKYLEKKPSGDALFLLQRMRDEAHRFARSYHHNLFSKILFTTKK